MGGYIALAFLDAYPDRVQGLVLANTRAGADTAEGKAGREETARNAFDKGMDVIARGMVPKVLAESTRLRDPDLATRLVAMMARQRPEAVAAASRGMALRADRSAMLASISIPALIITGDQDQLMPIETSRSMADAIPGSRMEVLADAGHLSNVEAPDDFNAAIRSWLKDRIAT
jgi:pimeloyl-ACP methyl ester carboxylesterase